MEECCVNWAKMKTSKKLHKQTIRGILSNRFYVGEMYSGGQYYPQCYPRLTDSYTFERCQEILEGKANHKVQKHEYVFKGLVRCKNCGGVVSTDINVHSAKKKGGEKIVYKYLFCPQCGGYRTREENGVEKVKEALEHVLLRLKENGIEADEIIHTREGEILAQEVDETWYYARKYMEGRECETRSRDDVLAAVEELAKLHLVLGKDHE